MIEDVYAKQLSSERISRSKMVSKLFATHNYLHMREETLFLAVYILDKYMSIKVLRTREIDLLLVTVLFIAAKYEETSFVRLSRIIEGYSKFKLLPESIIELEAQVLSVLNFKLNIICPYDFLKRLFLIHKIDDKDLSSLISCFLLIFTRSDSVSRPLSFFQKFRARDGRPRSWPENHEEGSQPPPEHEVYRSRLRPR